MAALSPPPPEACMLRPLGGVDLKLEMNMAAKKPSKKKSPATSKRKGSGPSKSDFIREKLKAGLSAADIIKAGAEAKMTIAPSFIYKLKSKLSGGGGKKKTSAKAKAAPKKKAGKLSASDFIRKHPTKSANEVVELGKKKGLKFSISSIYQTRAYDKKRKGGASKTKGKPGPKRKTPVFQVFSGGGGSEADLKKAALAVGFPRAREVVEELERGYMALLG